MGAQKNTITINGRIYDTATGQVIPSQSSHVAPKASSKVFVSQTKKSERKKITVFETNEQLITPSLEKPKPSHVVKETASHPSHTTDDTHAKQIEVSHKKPQQHPIRSTSGLHRKTERSETLMRHIVKKPGAHKSGQATVAISGLVAQPKSQIIRGDQSARKERASSTILNAHVSKFAPGAASKVTKRTAAIPVKQAPKHQAEQALASFTMKQAPPITVTTTKAKSDILATALQNAASHRAPNIGRKKSHDEKSKQNFARIIASLGIVFVLGGFFAYNNLPGISLRSASSKIGFSAAIPKDKPVGFGLSKSIQYQPGRVVLSFNSNTDNSGFTLSQEKTNQAESNLASTYIGGAEDAFSTTNTKGNTIYIYDKTQATWINNGILYKIKGTAALSTNQLLDISASL